MNVLAARSVRENADPMLLLDRLRIAGNPGVWEIVRCYFPRRGVLQPIKLLVKGLIGQRH
jgi:hypothetical protein